MMNRLRSIFVSNNYVSHVSRLREKLPNLSTLILSNNRISSLAEIDNIASLTKLELLSLTDNHVTHAPHYRLYVIHKIPSLKCLDFQKVKREEREEAARFFSSAEGKEFAEKAAVMSSSGSAARVAPPPPPSAPTNGVAALTDSQKAQVRNAIQAAVTKEDVDIIEKQLKVSYRVVMLL